LHGARFYYATKRGKKINRPTRATTSGRAYLGLRGAAKAAERTTAEYLRLYALEGFLLRLANSPHRDRFVLKGGVLLAAYGLRRPTTDIDGAVLQVSNEVASIKKFVTAIASIVLPAELDDGLAFDLEEATAKAIRDEDKYSGVRVRLVALLATAREPFHVDVNIGDPIWPGPAEISLPRLLEQEPIRLRGYPMEMVLAEKIVTALERGSASTRWRDFADIFAITRRQAFKAGDIRQALQTVADYRDVELANLDDTLEGYAAIGQARWAAWRSRIQLTDVTPEDFSDALESLREFANPILNNVVTDEVVWDPSQRQWSSRSRLQPHIRPCISSSTHTVRDRDGGCICGEEYLYRSFSYLTPSPGKRRSRARHRSSRVHAGWKAPRHTGFSPWLRHFRLERPCSRLGWRGRLGHVS
jgi:hypothetical protein